MNHNEPISYEQVLYNYDMQRLQEVGSIWRPRVEKGAALLDEIKPGWIDIYPWAFLHCQPRFSAFLQTLFGLPDYRDVYRLLFAGLGLSGNPGHLRPQPGPPPPLHGDGTNPGIWENSLPPAYYTAAKDHAFSAGTSRAYDSISSANLIRLWVQYITR